MKSLTGFASTTASRPGTHSSAVAGSPSNAFAAPAEPLTRADDASSFSTPSGSGTATVLTSVKSGEGAGSATSTTRPPSTSAETVARQRIASSGSIHGPPAWLQPGQLNTPMSIPSSVAFFKAVCMTSYHSSVKSFTGPRGVPSASGSPILPMKARSIPIRFIDSRSATTPSFETLPEIQYQ